MKASEAGPRPGPNGARGPRAHRTSRCATPGLAVVQPGIVGRRHANIGQDVGDNKHGWSTTHGTERDVAAPPRSRAAQRRPAVLPRRPDRPRRGVRGVFASGVAKALGVPDHGPVLVHGWSCRRSEARSPHGLSAWRCTPESLRGQAAFARGWRLPCPNSDAKIPPPHARRPSSQATRHARRGRCAH